MVYEKIICAFNLGFDKIQISITILANGKEIHPETEDKITDNKILPSNLFKIIEIKD